MAVACCDRIDGGYATAVFSAISMAIALVAAALVARAGAEFKAASASFERTRQAYVLDGLVLQAAQAVMSNDGMPRLSWSIQTTDGSVEVLAEPEMLKAHPRSAAEAVEAGGFAWLGVDDGAALRGRLRAAGLPGSYDRMALRRAAEGRDWGDCALSVLSPFGGGDLLRLPTAVRPKPRGMRWRAGELWRIRLTTSSGWSWRGPCARSASFR